MGLPKRDAARYTYGDYSQWADESRYELIDGTAYALAPAPTRLHQLFVGELYRQVANALQGNRCQPYIAPLDVRLPAPGQSDEQTTTVVQPDLLVVCDPAKPDDRGIRGAPEWIVEVLCPATASHDQIVKLAAYERAGVAEVWFVHPQDRIVSIYRLQAGSYGRAEILELTGTVAVSAVPSLRIDLDALPSG
jgi:Uma2 family endonuclease